MSRITISPVATKLSARVVGTPSQCIASLHRNSRSDERSTARPSAVREYGVFPGRPHLAFLPPPPAAALVCRGRGGARCAPPTTHGGAAARRGPHYPGRGGGAPRGPEGGIGVGGPRERR